ncbi:MAG TPA: FAD-dependent oxidoreductase, partial [Saprospiraceae bacterium]|nr:FAD-dependent oxidoreductase [Saprospiraceae bacterium]
SGWYGFPYHPLAQVVKVANHGVGTSINPEKDERIVTADHEKHLRDFLKISIPSLAEAPLVYTRLCCYTDTLDGHFWIDQHPEIKHLTVATGGSGHAFKMGPMLGEMIADTAEGQRHKWSARYSWRELSSDTVQEEEARYKKT